MRRLTPGATAVVVAALVAADGLPGPRLIANEYAHRNDRDPRAVRSETWDTTSGSLFLRNGVWWTGRPDGTGAETQPTMATSSAVFRVITRIRTFRDTRVAFDLRLIELVTTPRTPATAWDGVHVLLRYQSPYSLYSASVNRRDGTTAIKKKQPGGARNGGTYYTLATRQAVTSTGSWQAIVTTVETRADGSVWIAIERGGDILLEAIDDGSVGGPPLVEAGAVGIRGDNAEFEFRDFAVTDLDQPGSVLRISAEAP